VLEMDISSASTSPTAEPLVDERDVLRRAHVQAVKLLGRRDHSRFELSQKLLRRDYAAKSVSATLDELERLGYLDDSRFAANLAEQRLARGYGPRAIAAKLNERGIDSTHVQIALEGLNADWLEVAVTALGRRFDNTVIADTSNHQEARVARFLAGRGFSRQISLRALQQIRTQAS